MNTVVSRRIVLEAKKMDFSSEIQVIEKTHSLVLILTQIVKQTCQESTRVAVSKEAISNSWRMLK